MLVVIYRPFAWSDQVKPHGTPPAPGAPCVPTHRVPSDPAPVPDDRPAERALELAAEFGVSACDARFLGAARGLGTKLITEDGKLRRAAPALTQSLSQALAGY